MINSSIKNKKSYNSNNNNQTTPEEGGCKRLMHVPQETQTRHFTFATACTLLRYTHLHVLFDQLYPPAENGACSHFCLHPNYIAVLQPPNHSS